MKSAGVVILGLTVLGVCAGVFLGGFPEMWKFGRAADWPWWWYALAVPAMGAAYLVAGAAFEAAAIALLAPFRWRDAENP